MYRSFFIALLLCLGCSGIVKEEGTDTDSTDSDSDGGDADADNDADADADNDTDTDTDGDGDGDGDGDSDGDGDGDSDGDSDGDTDADGDADGDADTDGDSDGDGDSDSDSDADGDCDSGNHACVEQAPDNWSGPVVVAEKSSSNSLPGCTSDYPTTLSKLYRGLDGGDFECDCTCTVKSYTFFCEVHGGFFEDSACQNGNIDLGDLFWLDENNTVEDQLNVNRTYYLGAEEYIKSGAECTSNSVENIDDPKWDKQLARCEYDESSVDGEGCDGDELCLPLAPSDFSDELCIYRDGSRQCPSGSTYKNGTIYYTGFSNTRECDNHCDCDDGKGTCSGGKLQFGDKYNQNVGLCELGTVVHDERSIDVTYQVGQKSNLYCPASGAGKQGGLTESGAVTICCMD